MGNVLQSASEEPQIAQCQSHVLPFHEVEDDAFKEMLFDNDVYRKLPFGIPDRLPHSPRSRVPTHSIQDFPSTPYLSDVLPFQKVEDDELLRLFDYNIYSTFLPDVYEKPRHFTRSPVLTNPIQGFPTTPSSSSSVISLSPSSPLAGSSTPGTSTDIHILNTKALSAALDHENLERAIRDTADFGHQILALEEKEDLDPVEKERAMNALFETWAIMYARIRSSVDADCVKSDAHARIMHP